MENVGLSFTKKLGLVNGAEKIKFPNNLHLEKLGPNIASTYKYLLLVNSKPSITFSIFSHLLNLTKTLYKFNKPNLTQISKFFIKSHFSCLLFYPGHHGKQILRQS